MLVAVVVAGGGRWGSVKCVGVCVGVLRGRILPAHPRRLSPVSRGRGGLVFVKASCGRESAGVLVECTDSSWLQQMSLAAGVYCEVCVCVCVGELVGRFCPLTPDASPPFHGGEGGLVFVKASRGRESAGV